VNALSNTYRRAQAEGVVPPGYNPAAAMLEKPTAKREEARWLEVHEAALLLESARRYEPTNPWKPKDGKPTDRDPTIPFMYALIGTFLLTCGQGGGARARGRRHQLPAEHRHVPAARAPAAQDGDVASDDSAATSAEEILRAHIRELGIAGGQLFPSPGRDGAMVVELRKRLVAVAERAGWKPGEIRTKAFRHTYCAARLQTLDGGRRSRRSRWLARWDTVAWRS
jgi:hypothetical protein